MIFTAAGNNSATDGQPVAAPTDYSLQFGIQLCVTAL